MGDPREGLFGCVSYHAVTRYVQRVLGQQNIANDRIGTKTCAEAHCVAAGTTIRAVRRRILVPAVIVGLTLGASTVRTKDFVAKLVRSSDGKMIVASVFDEERKGRARFRSRSEYKTIMRRGCLRARRRPSPSIGTREVTEP